MRDFDVVRHRLLAQHLWGPGAHGPAGALRSLLAVQAQEYRYARWSLAQRCAGPERDAAAPVDDGIAEGSLLRTHVLRPTWHFVHRLDLRWLMELSGPRVTAGLQGRNRELGIDAATTARSNEVLAAEVAGGRHRTREELAAALRRAGLVGTGGEKVRGAPLHTQRTGHLLSNAELAMVLVSGAPRRSPGGAVKQTYALFAERVPPSDALDRDQALARLALRYFGSRGPATVKDCSVWSGLTMADVRTGLAALEGGALDGGTPDGGRLDGGALDGGRLESREFDGNRFYFGAAAGDTPDSPRADLLQCYDEMVMGYTPTRSYLLGAGRTGPPLPGSPAQTGTAALMHPLLIDGFVAGLWRQAAGTAVLEVRPGRLFSAGERDSVWAAAQRYGQFLQQPVTVQYAGPRDAGPHYAGPPDAETAG